MRTSFGELLITVMISSCFTGFWGWLQKRKISTSDFFDQKMHFIR